MGSLKKYYFGRTKAVPNTFIGGIADTVNTASLLAGRLGIIASRIKGFKIIGSDIQCQITGSYTIKKDAFNGSANLTFFNDDTGLVTAIEGYSFKDCTALMSIKVENCTSLGGYCFQNTLLTGINDFSKVSSMSYFVFSNSKAVADLPSLSVIDSQGFRSIHVDAIIGVPLALKTVNSGKPHTALQNYSYLSYTTFNYIGYVDDYSAFNTEVGFIDPGVETKKVLSSRMGLTTASFVDYQILSDRVRYTVLNDVNTPTRGFSTTNLTFLHDYGGNFKSIGTGCFYGAVNFSQFTLNAVTTISGNGSGAGGFAYTGIVNASFPSLTTLILGYLFRGANKLKTFSAPLLTDMPAAYNFQDCKILESVYMPLCAKMSYDVASSQHFNGVTKVGGTITVATALATANAGAPDGDIVSLTSSPRNWTVVYI